MRRGPHDFIPDADPRDLVAGPLAAASAHAWHADPRGGPLLARLAGEIGALLPGRRTRKLAAAVRAAISAVGVLSNWQRARVTALEDLLGRMAAAIPPQPWLGAGERPFLLVGTGGGGTRVLGEAALRLGLGLGPRVNESFDSVAWAPLVYDLFLTAADGPAARERVLVRAEEVHASWAYGDRPWGVKLPELTLVLPRFLEAFPAARVVFLTRHPVTASLRRHHITSTPDHAIGRRVLDEAYRNAGRDPARARRDPQHLRNALSWRLQIERVQRVLADLPSDRVLRLRLEDFAREPTTTTAALAAFLGRPMRADAVVRVNEGRLGDEKRRDRRSAEVLHLCGALARELGYA